LGRREANHCETFLGAHLWREEGIPYLEKVTMDKREQA
jgi:hypothetical protein